MRIPFNKPYMSGKELENIIRANDLGHLSGDGTFTKQASSWLEERTGAKKALLTHSCTAALEMSALLLDLEPGDEVIMPSFTFVSTANAFVLQGAIPVFVDVRGDTMNIDERLIEAAITPRTKAICVVHYAGVSCEMDEILDIASRHRLVVVEDAAQGVMSSYRGRPLGTIGQLGAFSFHETKNIVSGEGGALLCRDEEYVARAEVIREKGTNRSRFFRGQVDKYTWVDKGSSFLPGEVTAAFLCGQIDHANWITDQRLSIWNSYHSWAEALERSGIVSRPHVPEHCSHNAHMYYLLLPSLEVRTRFIDSMKTSGIQSTFHYIPLHSSPAGQKFGRAHGNMTVTDNISERLVRLPLWVGLDVHMPELIEIAERCILESA